MERIAYIDLAKFIAITLVCIGHVNSYNWGGLHHVIYSFHMPLFMFMSGLFFRVKPNLSVKELIIKRAKTLLLPAITVSILSILIMTFYGDMTLRKAAIEFYGCAWFLKCLFLCYIIVWLSMTVLKNVWLAFFVSEIFLLFVPHGYVFGLIFLIIFFWSGYIVSRYEIFKKLTSYRYGFLILACTTLLIFLFCASKGWVVHYRAIDRELLVENPLLLSKQFVVGLCGTFFVIALSYYISSINSKIVSLFGEIGKHTLGIYVLQILLLERILVFLLKPVIIIPLWETEYLLCPLIGIIITFLCFFLIKYLKRNFYLNLFLFGGTYK